ncbi:MAG: glycoside hydrolase family 3 protein [Clostridia bacterium]|nr:glycoside hydrolase family 3 protein [Clostridia bacterium]
MDKYARFKYQPCIPLGEDGRRVTASAAHAALAREAAGEGMVLLKNENGALPLKKDERVALFGKATIEYIKGGGGSGDVHCPYIRNIYEGMREKEAEGKIRVYMPLVDFYCDYVERESRNIPTQAEINKIWDVVNAMDFCQKRDDITYDTFFRMHVREAEVPDALIEDAAANADTAIITISRFSAEGTDRRAVEGDYDLSALEKELIRKASGLFGKVVVVLNTGAAVDCESFADDPNVQAVLMAWQGGMEGGMAIADILCGDVNPSGKLPDTIARSYAFQPSAGDFHESFDYLNYSEDIYVGYRYFETIPGAKEKVRYPFGFGLSYTTFRLDSCVIGANNGRITAALRVTNTGSFAGKEVIQLYYSAPQGKLGKPACALGAFYKTRLLAPGDSELIALGMDVAQMASFDDLGKVQKSAYVLEKGEYTFYLGTSVENAEKQDYVYTVEKDTVVQQLSALCRPFRLQKRLLADGSFETLPTGEESYLYVDPTDVVYAHTETEIPFDKVGSNVTLDAFVNQFTPDELKSFVGGTGRVGVCNTGCFGPLPRLGVPAIPTADGPAGLRLDEETGIPTTAFPSATLLAATWNEDLLYAVGRAAAGEVRENNLGVWLAPAMNIHRNPLCGRNFEYYSEDPLLAGKIGAAEIRGIQSRKVAVSLKHFACNNKEANRFGCDARISERALREIYLKCFEIAVREADPWTIMSSYNLINGRHTSESWELLCGILRNEWGFGGMITTDWGQKNDPVREVRAGNDLKMHIGYPDDLQAGLDRGEITAAHLKVCVMRILEMFMKLD